MNAWKKNPRLPRLVIAGISGDSGKTLLSLGLLLALRNRGVPTGAFKKGPDYIDAAWLSWASGRPTRNLDTFLMGFETALAAFLRRALPGGFNLIEGNRGLFDGVDAEGTHSTAALAKTLRAPVLLVLSATKVTRTAAAWVLGSQKLDPAVHIAGVVLNRVNGARHEKMLRQAIESTCGIPVVGALPAVETDILLPERHLGLVTPSEHPEIGRLAESLRGLVEGNVDVQRVLLLAQEAPSLGLPPGDRVELPEGNGLHLGYLRDSAFTFYYPENLEDLEASGARLVPVSALSSPELPPELDALYIGGGFPETHAEALCSNRGFLDSLRARIQEGIPVYAECGGLMLLSRAILWHGRHFPMAGVLPFEVEMCPRPQGHGYTVLSVDTLNPFFPVGLSLKGHEFHYSRIRLEGAPLATACAVVRGSGCYAGRDGILRENVWASYTHLHAQATPEWARGILRAARNYARVKSRVCDDPESTLHSTSAKAS
jgi:cobyrinic acid a,c-diamide synthase